LNAQVNLDIEKRLLLGNNTKNFVGRIQVLNL